MKRTDLINHLINKHGLRRYLEIGLQNAEINFDKIQCGDKTSVDPDSKANASHCMTSDVFFKLKNDKPYDLIFIDGLHTAEQVKKDFENALKVLSPDGFIVLHDCNPLKEEHSIVPRPTERGHWNGDVYKFACELGLYKESYKTVDIDNGCGVWHSKEQYQGFNLDPPQWAAFDKDRNYYLNLISWDDFTA